MKSILLILALFLIGCNDKPQESKGAHSNAKRIVCYHGRSLLYSGWAFEHNWSNGELSFLDAENGREYQIYNSGCVVRDD